MKKEAEDSRT